MVKRPDARTARKEPRQSRSRATVGAILEATVRILDREGSDAATTTRIAAVAGISIGTLYQYFSHRDAILDALQDREFERATALVERVLADPRAGRTPHETARAIVVGLLELYAAAPGLHRVLAIEGLRVVKAGRVHAFDVRVIAVIRQFLATMGPLVRRNNVDAASFVVYQSVRATMLARLLESPPGVSDDVLVAEVTDMLLSYLIDGNAQEKTARRARATRR
jgi:AcrR family transcriptional regulator